MSELPAFTHRSFDAAHKFIARALTHPGGKTHLRQLIAFEDGHFRALFDPAYFILTEGQTVPSKSQWNTLKKHLKRLDRDVFIFKEHGTTQHENAPVYYLDFGFLKPRAG